MNETAQLDARVNDRPDLAGRVERCVIDVLRPRLRDGINFRPFHSELSLVPSGDDEDASEPVGAEYIQVRATRNIENPPNSLIYQLPVEVIAHGQFSPSDVDAIETAFASARILSDLIRERCKENGIALPSGRPVSFDDAQGTRSGAAQDLEIRWSFTIHAQAIEVSKAA